jgi:hypothetical protein|tara:strand:- start:129 stop:329 length:201 start_codon:yes stop_codon:yes gene_type:complete
MISEGPMKQHMDRDTTNILKAEYTTYSIKDGVLLKETSIRQYKNNGKDYNDSHLSEPLVRVSNEQD